MALDDTLEPRPGDAGEGQVHQLEVVVLEQPAGHLGQLAVGAGVGRAAAQQDHAGGLRVGHVEGLHQAVELALQHLQDLAAHAQVAGAGEAHPRVAGAGGLDGGGQLHLHVAGGVEDEGDHQHAAGAAGGLVEAGVEQHLGVLDEAGLDAPGGVAFAPLGGEAEDLGVAVAVAGAVAHQQDGGVVHAGFSGEGAVALRKRCVKAGS